MKIAVLNGSPKGDVGITIQYVKFLEKKFTDHTFSIHHVGQKINKLEKDEAAFQEVIDDVKSADAILWAFPIYVLLIPSQYKRFIELIFERNAVSAFSGKHTATLSTSIHFYDNIGQSYLRAVCDDLRMNFAGMFSPDMDDLFEESEQNRLIDFTDNFIRTVEEDIPGIRHYAPLRENAFIYEPSAATGSADQGEMKVLVLTDDIDESTNIGKMVKQFAASFTGSVDVVNIYDIDMKGDVPGVSSALLIMSVCIAARMISLSFIMRG